MPVDAISNLKSKTSVDAFKRKWQMGIPYISIYIYTWWGWYITDGACKQQRANYVFKFSMRQYTPSYFLGWHELIRIHFDLGYDTVVTWCALHFHFPNCRRHLLCIESRKILPDGYLRLLGLFSNYVLVANIPQQYIFCYRTSPFENDWEITSFFYQSTCAQV